MACGVKALEISHWVVTKDVWRQGEAKDYGKGTGVGVLALQYYTFIQAKRCTKIEKGFKGSWAPH